MCIRWHLFIIRMVFGRIRMLLPESVKKYFHLPAPVFLKANVIYLLLLSVRRLASSTLSTGCAIGEFDKLLRSKQFFNHFWIMLVLECMNALRKGLWCVIR